MLKNNPAKDLTKVAPRSPNVNLGGFVIIARTIDKCRAAIGGNIGEYHFDCPLDNQLFGFKGIKGDDFKAYVALDHSDDEIVAWVKTNGQPKTDAEIAEWSKNVVANNYAGQPDKKAWLEGENARVGLPKDATLFQFLDADDAVSFKK